MHVFIHITMTHEFFFWCYSQVLQAPRRLIEILKEPPPPPSLWCDGFNENNSQRQSFEFVFLIITVRQNPYGHYIYDRYPYITRQNSREGVGGHGRAWPLQSKTFIVIRLFQLSQSSQMYFALTCSKYSFFFLIPKQKSSDLDRNSRVEKKHCITSKKNSWFYLNFLSRCKMYNILLSGAQLNMGNPPPPPNLPIHILQYDSRPRLVSCI